MDRSADSAPGPVPWLRLLPWALAVLLLHAWWLAPEPPAALRAPSASLHWRISPASGAARAPEPPAPPQRRGSSGQPPAAPMPAAAAAASSGLPTPALQWPASARWQYQLRWQGEEGSAQLEWAVDEERYRLSLHRQLGSRSLPSWQSEGLLGSQGLQPQRFSVQRSSGRRQSVDHEIEAGAQDRLSWIFQAAAIARAQSAQVGQLLQLPVSGWRGGVQAWQLRVEHDPDAPGLLRLRRLPPSPGSPLEQLLWLDPAQGHLPVRLRQRYDAAERWELQLEAPPPIGASTPSAF